MCSLPLAPPVGAKTKFSAVDAAHLALVDLPWNRSGGSRG